MIAYDLGLALSKASEKCLTLFGIGCAVDTRGLDSRISQELRQLLRFSHGSAKYDTLRECCLKDAI